MMCLRRLVCVVLAGMFAGGSFASVTVDLAPGESIRLTRLDSADIKIDGLLDEPAWRDLPVLDDFLIIEPDTLEDAPYTTEVRFFYTDRGLYVGVDMEQPAETLISRLSGRDNWRINRDSIGITLDTSGNGRYGYWFDIALGDSIADGTLLPERQYSRNWDGPWWAASATTDKGWSAEFFIPWSTVAMPHTGEVRHMGVYLSRKVAYRDERWGWPALPWTRPKFMSVLQPLEMEGVAPRQQYNIYPFASMTVDEYENDTRTKIGADLFWRPSTNTQLTATLNPDFGTVESDDVVINLSATETFFPEKRLFFLEGQDVFVATPRAETRSRGVGRGSAPYTMLNTRRIGGSPFEPVIESGVIMADRELIQPVDVLGAGKVTGQVGQLRYGVLAAFEDDVKFRGHRETGGRFNIKQSGNDYGVARLLYENTVRGTYSAFGLLSTATLNPDTRDAIVHGVDGHYLDTAGKLKIDGQAFTSNIENEDNGYGGFVDFEYTFRQGVVQRVGLEYFDEDLDINDLGFLERNDHWQIRTAHTRTSSDLGWAKDNEFDLRGAYRENNSEGLMTRSGIFFSDRATLDNLMQITARAHHFFSAYDDLNSFDNGTFKVDDRSGFTLRWDSNPSKPLAVGFGSGWEQEELGGNTYITEASIDWRPTDRFSVGLTTIYKDRKGWLLHWADRQMNTFDAKQLMPSFHIDYFLTARQQFRISMQWVGIKAEEADTYLVPEEPGDLIPINRPPGPPRDFHISQMSFQARYRWEIAPLSDLFVVYTRLSDLEGPLAGKNFGDLFNDAVDFPFFNALTIKLRYRLGS